MENKKYIGLYILSLLLLIVIIFIGIHMFINGAVNYNKIEYCKSVSIDKFCGIKIIDLSIPDDIKKDLNLITAVCDELKMALYIVGGFPRDIVFGFEINNDTDLDVTEKNGNSFELAFFVAAKYGLSQPIIYESI